MKLYYVSCLSLPTNKAFGITITETCKNFANKMDVILLIPKKKGVKKDDLFEFYNTDKTFEVKTLNVLDLYEYRFLGSKIPLIIKNVTFSLSLLFLRIKKCDLIYARDVFSLPFLWFKSRKLFLEIHYLPKKDKILFFLIFFAKKIIVITNFLKQDFIKIGYKADKILVAPDGVDIDEFEKIKETKEDLRKKLNLPIDKKIVLYSGHLYSWKGADLLLKVANNFQNILFVFVGGMEQDIKKFKSEILDLKLKNVLMIGYRPHNEIPLYLKSADILVLPNSGKEKISKYYTSPLKLFEYMASGVPIIASNLPSIKEILNKNNAIFFNADDSKDLAEKIKFVLKNKEFFDKIAKQALYDVEQYTWENRVKKIAEFVKLYS